MVYVLSFYDKMTAEFVPVGVYDNRQLAEKHMKTEPGVRWSLTEYRLNRFDYETFNLYHDEKEKKKRA